MLCSAIQSRVKFRIGEKRVKDPMMKDLNGGRECLSLSYKLGLNPDHQRVKDPMMKDDS